MNPLFSRAGDGHDFGDGLVCRIPSASTDGAWCAFEVTLEPGRAVPTHVHARDDELHYVLEGEVELRCGERTFTAAPGAMAVLPRGIPHAIRNRSAAPARLLNLFFPGGFDDFVTELDRSGSSDEAVRDSLRARHGVRLLRQDDA